MDIEPGRSEAREPGAESVFQFVGTDSFLRRSWVFQHAAGNEKSSNGSDGEGEFQAHDMDKYGQYWGNKAAIQARCTKLGAGCFQANGSMPERSI